MDDESLTRVCNSAFTTEDITTAKNLLFDSVKTTTRNIQRKKDGKKQRELEDMFGLFKGTDPENIPLFVAKDLHKLPPLTFDHVDVTRLLKDLLLIKNEMKQMKENYATTKELEKVKNDLKTLKNSSIVNNYDTDTMNFVNTKRGGSKINYDSGPIGLIHMPSNHQTDNLFTLKQNQPSLSATKDSDSTVPHGHTGPMQEAAEIKSRHVKATVVSSDQVLFETEVIPRGDSLMAEYERNDTSEHLVTQQLNNEMSFSNVVKDGAWKSGKKDGEWTLVQRRRLRNQFVGNKGKASTEPEGKFKAADIKLPLFINNVDKNTSPDDIVAYIMQKTNVEVTLEMIIMKKEKEYNAYKIFIPRHKLSVFMDAGLWPDGISFRRFVNFKRKYITKSDNGADKGTVIT